jgi:hypothetical protein
MKRISIAATALLAITTAGFAHEPPPGKLDLDEALARQSATDLIANVASAYDCNMSLHSFRRLGAQDRPVYMIDVLMDGTECDDALLLLARHGSNRDFVFRRWEPAPDIHEIDPRKRGD